MNATELWKRYQRHLCRVESVGLTLDVSRMRFDDGFLDRMAPAMDRAYQAMDALEKGAIANPDENRMVGHYWLRAPNSPRRPRSTAEIRDTLAAIKAFAAGVHAGDDQAADGRRGSPASSRSASAARRSGPSSSPTPWATRPRDKMAVHFLDNTDPDGIARELARLGGKLGRDALRRDQQERRHARDPQRHARRGRRLQGRRARLRQARRRRHRRRLEAGQDGRVAKAGSPGSRCGTGSAAGPASCRPSACCPAALQGIDIDAMLAGAAACDAATRVHDTAAEPRRPARPDVVPRHRRQGAQGHGRPALQGPAAAVQPLPPAARHGVARQAARPRRQAGRPGDQRLRQQGLDRPARLRPAAPRRRQQLLR